MDHKVKTIRCDNGTEFKNRIMNEFCEMKGIWTEFSVARTPQQNGRKPALSFMRPFGCLVTILNTLDHLGNQSNGNAGTKATINAGQAGKKTVPGPQYVLLPLLTSNSQGREIAQRNEFESMFGQDKDANGNITYRMFTPVSAVGSAYVNLGGSIHVNDVSFPNADLLIDLLMPDLEDTADLRILESLVVHMMMKLRV
nr:putative ribonuclease H-like domain-containing protein [Tanacetum cinerariifolium]